MTYNNQFTEDEVYMKVSKLVIHFADGERKEITRRQGDKLMVVNVEEYSAEHTDFIELVFKHQKEVKSVEELSRRCGFNSTKTFTRHFMRALHTTPKQWLISLKRGEALYYLKHTNKTFTEIAELLDFSGISHFNQFCNKQIGQNPTDIRAAGRGA